MGGSARGATLRAGQTEFQDAWQGNGSGGSAPIYGRATPRWGSEWKQATVKWYNHFVRFNTQGSVYANRDNYLDLDPTYRDALGRPLIRLTYNATDNDHKMSRGSQP